MKIKYFFLAAVDRKGEVVGIVIEAGEQSKLIPHAQFGGHDRLYLYRESEESMAHHGAQYYTQYFWHDVKGDGSAATYQKTRRDTISPKPWTVEVRSLEISL